jgi:hypothetical protein
MRAIIPIVFRRLACVAFFALGSMSGGSAVAALPHAAPPGKLQELAAWDANGLGIGVLTDVTVTNNGFSGKLHIENVPDELAPAVVGFKTDQQRLYNLALIYPGKSLVALLPALAGTAVAEAEWQPLLVLLTPPANAGASLALPAQFGNVKIPYLGGTAIQLAAGVKVVAHARFGGETAVLLKALGAPSNELAVSGKIDARLLSGAGLKNRQLQSELINGVDLRADMKTVALARQPAYLSFGDSALVIKGVSGKIASGIATSAKVDVGRGVSFAKVTINRDPVAGVISIASGDVNPGDDFLALGVAGAAIRQVALHGLIDERKAANDKFSLDGQYVVGGATPRDFSATLSGGTPAQYAVTVHADTTLGQLLGWSAPGLDTLVLKDVAFGNAYAEGRLSLKGIEFTVAVFKSPGQVKYNAALLSDATLRLPRLMSALQGTPLADLELASPAFVLVPPENAGNAAKLPDLVSRHVGMATAELKPGLNLLSRANTSGALADLLSSAGLSSSQLAVTGNLDSAIIAGNDGPLTDGIINATSLQAVLPAAAPPRKPPYLSFGSSVLGLKGISGKIAASITTSLSVNLGSGVRFEKVDISRDPVKRLISISGGVVTPGAKVITLPIAGAAVRQVAFNGLIDEQTASNDRFTLDGQYVVGANAPRDFTATLSGGTPAQYVVTVHADMPLGQLLGWSAPGLDALVLKDVSFGNGFTQGSISLHGMSFSAVLFKAAGQVKSTAAFLSDETFALPKLMSALQATPLADLELARPGFLLVPPENAGKAVRLPDAVARHVGAPAVDLVKGLNLLANGIAHGELAALLERLGINPTGLPVAGSLDPAILTNADGAALAQPFLDALDLRIPIEKFSLPGVARNVSVSNGYLALKGITAGIDASAYARLAVTAGSAAPLVFDTRARLLKTTGGKVVELGGAYAGVWNKPFGIGWLDVRKVTIAGVLGETASLTVAGTTDVGRVHDLKVSLDLATRSDGASELALQLTGADISLADIPWLASIPHAGDLKFRDLLVSPRAVGGTLKSTALPLLHDVQAVAFELAGHWNLAALLGEVKLSRLMVLPSFARPVLDKLQLGQTALLLSPVGISGRLAELPAAAQAHLLGIYGTPQAVMRSVAGVNVVTRVDPAPMGPAVTAFLPPGQQLVLQGSAGGVLGGGTPSLALSATIPALALPPSLAFIKLPNNAQAAFFIKLTPTEASAGVGVDAIISARLNKQTVDFDSTLAFELDERGGVAVDLRGKSLNRWRNAMGINGFALDAGTLIELKTAASSEQTLTIVANTHIGSRQADVAGSAAILGGVVDKGAFEGKLSELTLSDVAILFDDAVQAGGGQPIKADFPDAKLTDVDFAFASPGFSAPEIGLPEGGMRLAGDLWFLLKGKPLTRARAQISDTRFVMSGEIGDFTIGPVAMKGNSLDIRSQTMPPLPPQFRIRGEATLMNRHAAGEIEAGLAETAVVTSLDLGGLIDLDVHASFDTPAAGLDVAALASHDMALNGRLKSDLGAWLRGAGKEAVSKVFDSVGGDIRKLAGDLATARTQVDTLKEQIRKARARADAGAATVDEQIAQAQKKVDALTGRVNSLKRSVDSAKGAIERCDYSIKICYWWNWRGHCTKHKDVPNVARDAECEVDNARHAATVAVDETALQAAQTARAAADAVLTGLRKGEKGADIASLDPEVIALEATLLTADLALEAAQKLAQGAELGADQLAAGLKSLERLDGFSLSGATISASMLKAAAGKPAILGLEFEVAGKAQHLRLAFSLTDPAYNARQLETLALLVAKAEVDALPNAAPVVKHLLGDAFKALQEQASREVDRAAKDNGLEAD